MHDGNKSLELASEDELVAELALRFPGVLVVIAKRGATANDDDSVTIHGHGGATLVCGLAMRAHAYMVHHCDDNQYENRRGDA